MPRASAASSTRPDGPQTPMVAGSGTARGKRRARLVATGASAAMAVQLLERDQVAVGIAYHEPARAPIGRFRLAHHVSSLGHLAEARVEIVDVEMELRPIRIVRG